MVSVMRKRGNALAGPQSMKNGDSVIFRFGDTDYSLKLAKLNNALVGEDYASFIISDASSESLTEKQKIKKLVAAVESMTGAVFLRNGLQYSGKDAAKHLRQKLAAATVEITTASQFIDLVASRSSMTDMAYEIQFADGRKVPAGEFLRDELAKMEAGA